MSVELHNNLTDWFYSRHIPGKSELNASPSDVARSILRDDRLVWMLIRLALIDGVYPDNIKLVDAVSSTKDALRDVCGMWDLE